MKRIVLTFGLISGVLSSLMMVATIRFVDDLGEKGAVVGYTALVLAFLLVFFGIRSYRENVGHGSISFGRGLAVGSLIMLLSCVFYVATWEVIYFKFMPDFGRRMADQMVTQAKASGAPPEKIAATEQQAREFQVMYDKPLVNIAMTFMEPLPVGLLVTLVSAVALRRTRR